MNVYKYKNLECGLVFFVVCAKDITTADKLFLQGTGKKPTNPMVACQMIFGVLPKDY